MKLALSYRQPLVAAALAATVALGGCGYSPDRTLTASVNDKAEKTEKTAANKADNTRKTSSSRTVASKTSKIRQASLSERECLVRAMYFESHRSSHDGLLAVGTVVMNRVDSPVYPDSICAVVGQKRQFAPGVLTKPMSERERKLADVAADKILAGARHEKIGNAQFFHVATRRYKYPNMRYLTVAGGNIFYEKTGRRSVMAYAATKPAQQSDAVNSVARTEASKAITTALNASVAQVEDSVKTTPTHPVSFTVPASRSLDRAQTFSTKPLVLATYLNAR